MRPTDYAWLGFFIIVLLGLIIMIVFKMVDESRVDEKSEEKEGI